MAGLTRIDGETRKIKHGICMVDGTLHTIRLGITRIDGTLYHINFGKKTVINVTKETQMYNDTYITVNGGERISSTQTLEFEAGESVTLYAYAQGLGPAYPGIISLNGVEVGRVENNSYSYYELDCTGHIVDVIINDYNMATKLNGRIDITTD